MWLVYVCILEGSLIVQGKFTAHPSKENQNQIYGNKKSSTLCFLKGVNKIWYPKVNAWVNNEDFNKKAQRRNCLGVILKSSLLLFFKYLMEIHELFHWIYGTLPCYLFLWTSVQFVFWAWICFLLLVTCVVPYVTALNSFTQRIPIVRILLYTMKPIISSHSEDQQKINCLSERGYKEHWRITMLSMCFQIFWDTCRN